MKLNNNVFVSSYLRLFGKLNSKHKKKYSLQFLFSLKFKVWIENFGDEYSENWRYEL